MTTGNIALRMHRILSDKTRKCIKCGEEFPSTGSGNRLCLNCKRRNANMRHYDRTSAKAIGRAVKI